MKLARTLSPTVTQVFQDRYQLASEIGAGGFGVVYSALQIATGQKVAVKVLRFVGARDPKAIEKRIARLEREMRLCAQLHHPNIVGLIDFGHADDGSVYSVFEFIPGKDLEEVLAEEGALEPAEAWHLMLQTLDALACAHAQSVIHRDLKPSNVMVTSTGARRNALVLDFGIGAVMDGAPGVDYSRLTATNEVLGTIAYAAPEQLFNQTSSPASDLYSWGLVFLECLTGVPVIRGDSLVDVLFKQLGAAEIALPPALRAHPLGRLLASVLARKPEDRPASTRDVMKQLEACTVTDLRRQDLASPPGALEPVSKTRSVDAAARLTPTGETPALGAAEEDEESLGGERRQVTIVCATFSVVAAGEPPPDIEEADELLCAAQEACSRIAARFRGHPSGAVGNQALFWFGFPAADEDDARRAARAALGMIADVEREALRPEAAQRMRLDLRIAIHTGIVVSRPRSAPAAQRLRASFGTTSNLAARMSAAAAPGEVLVSDGTLELLRHQYSFATPRAVELGAAGTVDAYRLEWPTPEMPAVEAERRETALIGRDREIDLLLQRWDDVRRGHGQVVLVTGEPGIGKSRLVREFASRIRDVPHRWLACRSTPEDRNNALHPVVDMLERTFGLGVDEAGPGRLERLKALLQSLDFTLDEAVPLFCKLLGIPLNGNGKKNGHPNHDVAPHLLKAELLNALVSLFVELSEREAVVLAAEDLHWTDPSTLELLSMIVEEVSSARILVLFSARPAFAPPWSLSAIHQVQLGRLGREEVQQMVQDLTGTAGAPSSAVLDQIVERTDGVPLFVEELTRMLSDTGLLTRAPSSDAPPRSTVGSAVPATLRDLLTARLDRLGRAKGTAQIAAAIGREFTFELLSVVSPITSTTLLQEDLDALIAAELVHRKRRAKGHSYAFKHALIRDTAYESMLKSARRKVHADIARALSERLAGTVSARPDLLARHLAEAGREADAALQVLTAADACLQRSANAEALGYAQQALGWLLALPAGQERDEVELCAQEVVITALTALRGPGAAEVETAIARMQALLIEAENSRFAITALTKMGVYYQMRARLTEAMVVSRKCLALAERADDTLAQAGALTLLSQTLLYTARYDEARAAALRALALYDPDEHPRHAIASGGLDFRATCYGTLSFALWFMGHPDQALTQAQRGLALMEDLGHANSIAFSLLYLASTHRYRRDLRALGETCGRLHEMSQRHGLFLGAFAGVFFGSLTGDTETPRQILAGLRAYGQLFAMPYWSSTIAETHAAAGRFDAALEGIEECIAGSESTGEVHILPELLRLKGTFLLARDAGAADAAERCFRQAIELARSHRSRMCELRAAVALAPVLRASGRAGEARALVESIYGEFTEGFTLPDLEEARTVVAELSS